jgi:sugar-phosphatase
MDGTLIDSEHLTAKAIESVLTTNSMDLPLADDWFFGLTWSSIAKTIVDQNPTLWTRTVETVLQQRFHQTLIDTRPPEVPGAVNSVRSASRRFKTAIVSSSNRVSVEHVAERLGIRALLDDMVTSEDCVRSKPDPQCFQIGAQRLGVDCSECLVFEDSIAGLTAARAAGMRTVAIGDHHPHRVADMVIENFEALPADFFGDGP